MRYTWYILCIVYILSGTTEARPLSELRPPPAPVPSEKAPCPVPSIDQPSKIIGAGYDLLANVYWRVYDLKGTRKGNYFVEYEVSSTVIDGEMPKLKVRPFPSRYFLDTDDDGFYDTFYHDVKGDGRCEDIVPFEPASRDPRGVM